MVYYHVPTKYHRLSAYPNGVPCHAIYRSRPLPRALFHRLGYDERQMEGMVNVLREDCTTRGCCKTASYGFPGEVMPRTAKHFTGVVRDLDVVAVFKEYSSNSLEQHDVMRGGYSMRRHVGRRGEGEFFASWPLLVLGAIDCCTWRRCVSDCFETSHGRKPCYSQCDYTTCR